MLKDFYKIVNVFKIIFLLGYVVLTMKVFIYTLSTGQTIFFAVSFLMLLIFFFILINFRLEQYNDPVKWITSLVKWSLTAVVVWMYFRLGDSGVGGYLMTFFFLIPLLLVLLTPDFVRGTAEGIMRLIYPDTTVKVQKDYSTAKKYVIQHKFNEAIEEYRNILKEDPKDINAQFEIACIYADNIKDYQKTIEEFDKTLAMGPEDSIRVLILNRLADIYSRYMNDTPSAIARLERVIIKFPPDHKYARQAHQRIKFLKEHS